MGLAHKSRLTDHGVGFRNERQSRSRGAEGAGRRRGDRHRAGLLHRHAGAPARQARHRPLLRRPGRPRDACLRLPARAGHGDGAGPGLRGGVLGPRLRRLRHPPRPRDPAPHSLARGHRAGARRRGRPPRRGRAAFAARGPQAPGGARARARLQGQHGVRARVLRVQRAVRERPREDLPQPQDRRLVHRGLPHPPDHQGGEPDPGDPQRHGRRRHPGRVLEGRVGPGPGRAEPALRGSGRDGGSPRHLQERRQGDRASAGQVP